MSEIATTIASAVEEQGAATREIARNVSEASGGTQEVSSNIADAAARPRKPAAGPIRPWPPPTTWARNRKTCPKRSNASFRKIAAPEQTFLTRTESLENAVWISCYRLYLFRPDSAWPCHQWLVLPP